MQTQLKVDMIGISYKEWLLLCHIVYFFRMQMDSLNYLELTTVILGGSQLGTRHAQKKGKSMKP